MPHTVPYYPKAVVMKGRLYVGGGQMHYASKDHSDMLHAGSSSDGV